MSTPQQDENYTRVIPEFIDNNLSDANWKQKLWVGCCVAVVFVSASLSVWPVMIIALLLIPGAYQTDDGIVYERVWDFPKGYRISKRERQGTPFFVPPENDEVTQIDEGAKDVRGRRSSRRRDYSTPFTSIPIALQVPGFGETPRGILHDPIKGTDRFLVSVRGWTQNSLDLGDRDWSQTALANVIKESLSIRDGGIGFKYICGSRPHNIHSAAHQKSLKTRVEVLEALQELPEVVERKNIDKLTVTQRDALLYEELLDAENRSAVDPMQLFEFEVPRPPSWGKAIDERGYLTETEIEESSLAMVMRTVFDGLNSLGVIGVEVLDMPSMFTQIRRSMDIGGIDEFHREMHLASLRNEGEYKVPWHVLLKSHNLWPRRIPRHGKNYVLTDQTLHRVIRLYRFRVRRVLPGFMQDLQMLADPQHRWWFTFSYVGQSTSAHKETQWLTRQIVRRRAFARVMRSGDRHETPEEREHRLLPYQQQEDLYASQGPSIRANRYITISVPLPALSDEIDEAEQLAIGLRTLRLAENQLKSRIRRKRIVSRTITNHRQIVRMGEALV